jgi:transposase
MHHYPSDISREAFEIIWEDLERAKKPTRPREKDLYAIFCAIVYLIQSGCQWRMLPTDVPQRVWGITKNRNCTGGPGNIVSLYPVKK